MIDSPAALGQSAAIWAMNQHPDTWGSGKAVCQKSNEWRFAITKVKGGVKTILPELIAADSCP